MPLLICSDCGAHLNYKYTHDNPENHYFSCKNKRQNNGLCPTTQPLRFVGMWQADPKANYKKKKPGERIQNSAPPNQLCGRQGTIPPRIFPQNQYLVVTLGKNENPNYIL